MTTVTTLVSKSFTGFEAEEELTIYAKHLALWGIINAGAFMRPLELRARPAIRVGADVLSTSDLLVVVSCARIIGDYDRLKQQALMADGFRQLLGREVRVCVELRPELDFGPAGQYKAAHEYSLETAVEQARHEARLWRGSPTAEISDEAAAAAFTQIFQVPLVDLAEEIAVLTDPDYVRLGGTDAK